MNCSARALPTGSSRHRMPRSFANGSLVAAMAVWVARRSPLHNHEPPTSRILTPSAGGHMCVRYAASAIAVATVLLVGTSAFAHHSFAPHFDASKPVSISGTITKFEAQNPHSYVHINAVDENGRTHEYVCESHGVTQLTRNGVTSQILKVGTKIRVTGSLSRHSPYMCFFDSIELADGRILSVNGAAGSGGTPPPVSVAPRNDIFGSWLLAPIANRS